MVGSVLAVVGVQGASLAPLLAGDEDACAAQRRLGSGFTGAQVVPDLDCPMSDCEVDSRSWVGAEEGLHG